MRTTEAQKILASDEMTARGLARWPSTRFTAAEVAAEPRLLVAEIMAQTVRDITTRDMETERPQVVTVYARTIHHQELIVRTAASKLNP